MAFLQVVELVAGWCMRHVLNVRIVRMLENWLQLVRHILHYWVLMDNSYWSLHVINDRLLDYDWLLLLQFKIYIEISVVVVV